jgi:phage-related protein
VLLALEVLSKKTRRTPPEAIRLAERRLAEWRARAQKG